MSCGNDGADSTPRDINRTKNLPRTILGGEFTHLPRPDLLSGRGKEREASLDGPFLLSYRVLPAARPLNSATNVRG